MKLNLSFNPILDASSDELLALSAKNTFDCFKTLLYLPNSKHETNIRGFEGVVTKRPSALFNFFTATNEISSFDKAALAETIAALRSQSIPMCFELHQNVPSAAAEFLQSLKPLAVNTSTQIIYEANGLIPIELPSGLSMQLIQNDADIHAFLNVMQSVWPDYGDLVKCFGEWIQHYGYGPKKPFQTAILRDKSQVLGIGSLFFGNGIVSPFNIAVPPALQKHGYGQIIIKSLVNLAHQNGAKYFAATGTEVGMNLYRKAPILEVGQNRRFIF